MTAPEFLLCVDCNHPGDVHGHHYDAYADEPEWWECGRKGCACRPTWGSRNWVDIAEWVDLDAVELKAHRDHLLEVFDTQREVIENVTRDRDFQAAKFNAAVASVEALQAELGALRGFAGKCDYCQRTFGPDVKIKYADSAAAQCVECWGGDD